MYLKESHFPNSKDDNLKIRENP